MLDILNKINNYYSQWKWYPGSQDISDIEL